MCIRDRDKLDNGSALITGVIVARRDVVEANPGAVDSFLQNYAASVEWVNANNADAAQLIAEYGIIEAAPVAEKALPYCNICLLYTSPLVCCISWKTGERCSLWRT